MKLFVSLFDVSNLIWLDEIRLALFANLELWISYTRFFLNIEIFWNNNIIWSESLLKFARLLHIYDLKNRYNRDLRIEFWNSKLEKALWSWSSHSLWFEEIIVIVIFASKFVFFDSYSVCNKNLKIIFVNDSKKAWFDDFIACCFQYRESDFVQFTIFDLMTDSWLIDRKFWIRVIFYFLFFYSLHRIDELSEKKWLNAKDVEYFIFIDEINAIALNTSNFENFLDFLFSSHHNIQRSIRSNSNLWRCFWHDSILHAS